MSQTHSVGSNAPSQAASASSSDAGRPGGPRKGAEGTGHAGEFARLLGEARRQPVTKTLPQGELPRRRRNFDDEAPLAAPGAEPQPWLRATTPKAGGAGLEGGTPIAGVAGAGRLDALANQIVSSAELRSIAGGTELRLGLHAQDLGLSGVRIAKDAAGKLDIALEAQPGAATNLVQQNLGQLVEALAHRGLEARSVVLETPSTSAATERRGGDSLPSVTAASERAGAGLDRDPRQGRQSRGRSYFDALPDEEA
jgi:hypothetical protein